MTDNDYDVREKRRQDYYAAVHVDRLLNSTNAVMRKADEEQAELVAKLALVQKVADEWSDYGGERGWGELVDDIRAALEVTP